MAALAGGAVAGYFRSEQRILRLLLWQFSKPLLMSLVPAWPLSAWWTARWLAGFDSSHRAHALAVCARRVAALAVAWATVSAHALTVARTSPIQALGHD